MYSQKQLADLFNKIAPPRDQQFYSVGHCCVLMNITPGQLQVLLDAAEVSFKRMVDTVLYIDGDDLQRVVDVFNGIAREIDAVADSVPNN